MAKTQSQAITSKETAVKAFHDGKIDLDEYTRIVEGLAKPAQGRTIKRNSKGGLFVRDPAVKAYSENKGKDYVVSINLPWEAAAALFSPKSDLLAEVQQFVVKELTT